MNSTVSIKNYYNHWEVHFVESEKLTRSLTINPGPEGPCDCTSASSWQKLVELVWGPTIQESSGLLPLTLDIVSLQVVLSALSASSILSILVDIPHTDRGCDYFRNVNSYTSNQGGNEFNKSEISKICQVVRELVLIYIDNLLQQRFRALVASVALMLCFCHPLRIQIYTLCLIYNASYAVLIAVPSE